MPKPVAPSTPPLSTPKDVMEQSPSLSSKSAEAALKDVVGSFSQTVSKLEETINKLLNPPKPPEPPAAPTLEAVPTPQPKKSMFKTIEDELNANFGF